jgi:flagellar basal body-associated protein FliL
MICQNCRANVDDDLIFCTNCGERLVHPQNETQTVLINNPAATKQTINSPTPKQPSNLKWIALIIALIAIPASIFGVYLLMNQNRAQVTQNINKPSTPAPTPTRKANTNQNTNANIVNTNANISNTNVNANTNAETPNPKNEIMNERIEIAPQEHYALPFEIEKDNSTLLGNIKILEGENFKGYVYLQTQYDEHFPDETYKMSSFEAKKSADVKQTLVAQKYVLIFVNNGDKPMVVEGKFSIE